MSDRAIILRYVRDALRRPSTSLTAIAVGTLINVYGQVFCRNLMKENTIDLQK